MKYSDVGLKMTEHFEGCRLEAYLDSVGVPTIGYGHTRGVKLGDICTPEQAEAWLRDDIECAEHAVNALVKVELQQYQFDALVDFVFNLGAGAFAHSTLLKLINAGGFKAAELEFRKWSRAGGKVLKGLYNRRIAEEDLFDGPDTIPQP